MRKSMHEIVSMIESTNMISEGITSVLSESSTAANEARRMATEIVTRLSESNEDSTLQHIFDENAQQAVDMITNLLESNKGLLSESSQVNIQLITTSMATLFRQPYECHAQRMFNTEVAATPEMVIETIIHKIKSPNHAEALPVYDAFKIPGEFTSINSTKVAAIGKAGAGISVKSASRVDLISGQPQAMRVNKTLKLEGMKVVKTSDSSVIALDKITLKRGCSPYMDQKDGIINATYIVEIDANTKPEVTISAKISGDRFIENISVSYLNETHEVTHLYVDATLSSEEHTHPITLGVENSFRNYPIGTREHIEVGETIEKIIFTKKSTGSELSGTDIVAMLADRMTDIAFRVKDDRLAATLKEDKGWLSGTLSLKQPGTSQFFKISEYINDYFFNQIDGYCTVLKLLHNFENCHFVAEISPVLAQYIDADRKIVSDNKDGKTAFMYDLKYMSKANKITFVVAPNAPMNQVKLNLLPDDTKKTPYRTFDNFEFDSFMTDKLRRHDNPTQSAIVYSEISQEYVHNAFSILLRVNDVPTLSSEVVAKIKAANESLYVE